MNRRHFLRNSVAAGVTAALPMSELLAAVNAMTDVEDGLVAVTGDRAEVQIERQAVQELADSLRGNLLLPGNSGYDSARSVLNPSIDKHPAMIVQPTGVADIQNAVQFAADRDLLLAVKCGGHSYSGKSTCEGGMQIDLSTFRHCRVDPAEKIAYVAGGSLLAALDHEAMAHGLVTPAGTVSHTGVGGLTLGGGFGRISRRFGLTLDNVRAVDLVTADGRLLRASAEKHPDLYWAVRGGGGNFGIATNFEYYLHPMERTVIGGDIVWPLDRAREVMRFYADYSMSAPDDLYCDAYMSSTVTGEGNGVGMHICYSGPASKADAVLGPIKKLGKPAFDGIGPIDYVALQKSWDWTDPRNVSEYIKSGFINDFPTGIADALVEGFEGDPGRNTMVYFQQSGGAIGRVPADATAFPHRKSENNLIMLVGWPLGTEPDAHVAYIRRYWQDFEAATDGYYTNDDPSGSQVEINRNYQGNFPRLLEIKRRYDPDNLFRLNTNIAPG